MIKKIALSTVLPLGIVLCSLSATTLTNFGSSSFTIDLELTNFDTTQNTNSLELSGSDSSTLAGSITVIDISSLFGNQISVSGNVTTDPGTSFGLFLSDSSFNEATFTGGLWVDILDSGSTLLSLSDTDPGFDPSLVEYVDIRAAGTGVDSVSATLDGATIVPEPSAFALIAGCFALAWVTVRRRA